MKKYVLFIGRWQPFHNGHAHIIDQVLAKRKSVLIAVRDTPTCYTDPFSLLDRIRMIRDHYRGQDVCVIPIPDIESVSVGRQVGYEVHRPFDDVGGSKIRQMMADGDEWREFVPEKIAEYIDALVA